MDIWCHFVIALLVIHLPAILAEGCDDGWEEYGDMCYYFSYNITASRDGAQDKCIDKGGVLASIPNKGVHDYLRRQMSINSTIVGGNNHWIGLVGTNEPQTKNEWRWLNGVVASDFAWHTSEPSSENTVCGKLGDYGTVDLALGNTECSSSILYICETTTAQTHQDWIEHGRHWYFFSKAKSRNFIQSFNECLSMGASLASIETQNELEFIKNSTSKSHNYWIGLTTLHWLDHSPITYINFWTAMQLDVNNPCVYLHYDENRWESDCKNVNRFICQKATSTSTTVTTTSSTTTSTSTMTKQTTPSFIPSTSTTTQPEPPNNIIVSDTDDKVQMTTESTSNIGGKGGITETMQMDKADTYIIVGVLVATLVVSGVIVIVTLLVGRRKLKTKEHVYYNNTAELGNEANQGVNYINTQSGSTRIYHDSIQNIHYEDVDFEDDDRVTNTRPHADTSPTFDNSIANYQDLRFDTHPRQHAQNIVTYQELTLE